MLEIPHEPDSYRFVSGPLIFGVLLTFYTVIETEPVSIFRRDTFSLTIYRYRSENTRKNQ